jgi:microcystin-dependent protein
MEKVVVGLISTMALGLVGVIWTFSSSLLSVLSVPSGTILMTENDCGSIGTGWMDYAAADGRFPVGDGSSTDANGKVMQFEFGQSDEVGEYEHALTESEIPSHSHLLLGGTEGTIVPTGESTLAIWGRESDYEYNYRLEAINAVGALPTLGRSSVVGQNDPHNNLPPFFVVRYCIKR